MKESELILVDTEYSIFYSNKKFIPIDEVISSLRALESNIHYTSKFIEKAYPNYKVINSEIFIENLKSGSLDVKLIVRKSLHFIEKSSKSATQLIPSKETVKDIIKQSTIALII